MLTTPDGHCQIELFEYLHRVALSFDDIDVALEIAAKRGCFPLRGVATYQNAYKLTYLRGPSGILVMLAQDLTKG